MRVAAALLGLALLILAAGSVQAAPLGDFIAGTAVPFGGPADGKDPHVASGGLIQGSCGYGELPAPSVWPNWVTVAVSPASFLAANATRHPLLGCGACLEIHCDPTRPGLEARWGLGRCPDSAGLVALVTDTCKDCSANKLTLHYLAFQQRLASPDQGEVPIRYRLVECPAPGGIVVGVDTFRATEGGYLRLSLENTAGTGAISSIELRKSPLAGDRMSLAGTGWTKMTNGWGAKWELSGVPEVPLDIRITSDNGQELVARQAIREAGVTGKLQLDVQFSTAEANGTADALTTASIVPTQAAPCNTTLMAALRSWPELSTLVAHLEAAGMAPLLEDRTSAITLFAPTNDAWACVSPRVDLGDRETLQEVLLFLIAQGQIVVPDARQLLPEDLAAGGVALKVDTLQGAPLQVLAGPQGIALQDGSSLTPDAIVVNANNVVCSGQVVNFVDQVPLPGWRP